MGPRTTSRRLQRACLSRLRRPSSTLPLRETKFLTSPRPQQVPLRVARDVGRAFCTCVKLIRTCSLRITRAPYTRTTTLAAAVSALRSPPAVRNTASFDRVHGRSHHGWDPPPNPLNPTISAPCLRSVPPRSPTPCETVSLPRTYLIVAHVRYYHTRSDVSRTSTPRQPSDEIGLPGHRYE